MIKKLLKKIFGAGGAKEAPAPAAAKHEKQEKQAKPERSEKHDAGRGRGRQGAHEEHGQRGGRSGRGERREGGGETRARGERPAERQERRPAPAGEKEGAGRRGPVREAPAAGGPPEGEQKRRRRRGGRGRGRARTEGQAGGQPGGQAGGQPGKPVAEPAAGPSAAPAPEPEASGAVAPAVPAQRVPRGPRESREPREPGREGEGRGSRGRGERRERGEAVLEPIPLPELPPIPPWTPPEDPALFANYDLPEEVRAGIRDAGFVECTPVQAKVLTVSLQGKDIAAQSQTGTGKTAAFLVTIYSRLLRRGPVDGPKPRALVIAPTRELAVQIESDARLLGAHTGLTTAAIFGGVDYDKQRHLLQEGADIVIGTPGRLIDYLKQGAWRPEGVEILVIDEADRMLDMGFIRDLRFILRRLPHYDRRQSMLFSATMSWNVMELTYEYMNIPAEIRTTPERMTAEKAVEELYHVARDEKPALLLGLLAREKPERTMIFTNTKVEAEKVGKLLEHHGLRARAITGNLEQARRLKLMEEFKAGDLPIMVATDVASRGLHIEAVSHVVNWDLPQDPEDYVHRIGRTARAGAAGKAISLADESGALNLEAIEKLIGYKIPVVWHESGDLGEVKPGWREAAARERRERERERDEREGRVRHGEAPRSGSRDRRRSGGGGGGGNRGRRR